MKIALHLTDALELPALYNSLPLIPFDLQDKELVVTGVYRNPIADNFMVVCEMFDPIDDISLYLLELSSLQLEADCNEPECPA